MDTVKAPVSVRRANKRVQTACAEGFGVSLAHIRVGPRSEKHLKDFVLTFPSLSDRIVVDTRLGSCGIHSRAA